MPLEEIDRGMDDTLAIPPIAAPIDAVVDVPGSKSITNRALLVAALASGDSFISDALFSDDTHWFVTGLRALGIPVTDNRERVLFRVSGLSGTIPASGADLFVGNAGTAARFLTALVALGRGTYRLDGISRMRERPMANLLTALEQLGAEITPEGQPGYLPIVLRGRGLEGGNVRLRAEQTSQQLSALLMIAPYARQDTTIVVDGALVSLPYIDITRRVMADFGVEITQPAAQTFHIQAGHRYQPCHYAVEPDASNASYFFAAAAITGGRVRVNGLSRRSCQGDIRFLDVLEAMGCRVVGADTYTEVIGPQTLRGVDVDMNNVSDMMQTLAAIAPLADAPVTIRNVRHIRWKETDRIRAVATELQRLGIHVEEFDDGLRIHPGHAVPTAIETYDDHRMAMAFAVLGLRVPGLMIKNPSCTAKTFPDFFTRFLRMAKTA